MLPFIAVTLLGLAVTALAHRWLDLFENTWIGAGIWIAACLAYGLIYDRRQARKRREAPGSRLPRE